MDEVNIKLRKFDMFFHMPTNFSGVHGLFFNFSPSEYISRISFLLHDFKLE